MTITSTKLDRALDNSKWLSYFSQSTATFQANSFSNHCPCVINLSVPLPASRTRPFKFFNFLTQHPLFAKTLENTWSLAGARAHDLSSFSSKMKSLRPLKSLNKDNFSDIQVRVSESHTLLTVAHLIALNQPSIVSFLEERNLHTRWSFLRGIQESFFQTKNENQLAS